MDATTPSNSTRTGANDSALHHRRITTVLLTIALVLYWLAAFLGTHYPIPDGVIPNGVADRVLHFVGYAILASLLMGLRASRGPFGWYSLAMRWMVLAAYGAFDEATQHLVGRNSDVVDWYADVLGALLGLGLVVLLVRVCALRMEKRVTLAATDKAT